MRKVVLTCFNTVSSLKIITAILVLITTCSFSFSQINSTQELKMVRIGFYEAVHDSKKAKPLFKIIADFHSKSSVVKAYQGATLAIMAKDKWNPFVAIKLLNKSEAIINVSVKKLPNNLEIRFIRFAVQKNIPKFLGLSKNIDEDKKFIIKHIDNFDGKELNKNLRGYILQFLIEQGGYNVKEIKLIKAKLG